VHLAGNGSPLANVPVYLFSDSDSYLGLTGKTDDAGNINFQVPAGMYKFRADYQANKYWATAEVVAESSTSVDLHTGGGSLAVTVRTDDATII